MVKKTEKWRKISKRLKKKHKRLIEIETVRKTNRHKDRLNSSHIKHTKRQSKGQTERHKESQTEILKEKQQEDRQKIY